MFIKAEMWAQGTGGTQNWKANLNNIDTSAITDMTGIFGKLTSRNIGYGLEAFNGDISDWYVSSVTDMNGMFYKAKAFN